MATVPQVITYEDWLAMPVIQDGVDEVVEGEYRTMPPARYAHAEILRRLNRLLDRQVDEAKVAIYDSNFGLLIRQSPLICRSPDLAVYWTDKIVIQDGLFCSPPGLIVEVLSPSETRSRKREKLKDYADLGVPEVWIISPEAETVEICSRTSIGMETTAIVAGQSISPKEFPNVSISIAALWPEQK